MEEKANFEKQKQKVLFCSLEAILRTTRSLALKGSEVPEWQTRLALQLWTVKSCRTQSVN